MVVTAPAHPDTAARPVSTLTTLLRLRRWARPHRRAIAFMLAAATGAMLAQAVVPIVIGRVVDGPIRHRDTGGLWALSGLALVLGVTEAGLFFARRRAMAVAALGVETDLRRDLFAHVQRLPVSFHDRWPSRPAAVPPHHRPVHAAPLHRPRRGVPAGQHAHDLRRPRPADQHPVLARPASCWSRWCRCSSAPGASSCATAATPGVLRTSPATSRRRSRSPHSASG